MKKEDLKGLGITKGEWTIRKSKKGRKLYIDGIGWEGLAMTCGVVSYWNEFKKSKEGHANAKLIADAGTTANQCGKLPSELLEENKRLKYEKEDLRQEAEDLLIKLMPPEIHGECFDCQRLLEIINELALTPNNQTNNNK